MKVFDLLENILIFTFISRHLYSCNNILKSKLSPLAFDPLFGSVELGEAEEADSFSPFIFRLTGLRVEALGRDGREGLT